MNPTKALLRPLRPGSPLSAVQVSRGRSPSRPSVHPSPAHWPGHRVPSLPFVLPWPEPIVPRSPLARAPHRQAGPGCQAGPHQALGNSKVLSRLPGQHTGKLRHGPCNTLRQNPASLCAPSQMTGKEGGARAGISPRYDGGDQGSFIRRAAGETRPAAASPLQGSPAVSAPCSAGRASAAPRGRTRV